MKKMVQFIAGAKCPKCGAQDTIAINAENDLLLFETAKTK